MDNASRSERTRAAVISAALTIIARDGGGNLTLDAIARESGISKGGVMHQFRTKKAVLEALLEHQSRYFRDFSRQYLEAHGSNAPQPHLATQIATLREVLSEPNSLAFATLAAVALEPAFLRERREESAETIAEITAESDDPDISLLRWSAAHGLTLTALLGLSPLSPEERERLFDILLDDTRWSALSSPKPSKAVRSRRVRAAG